MITARQFEESMQEIVDDYKDKPETMRRLIDKLMIDTLDCYGYTAGLNIFENVIKKDPLT